MGGNAELI